MTVRGRRRLDAFLLLVGALTAGVIATAAAAVGDLERVVAFWTTARIDSAGGADIVEVIDYDFGPLPKHGIFRDVPSLPLEATVVVSSPTAPDDVLLEPVAGNLTRIRVGDPSRTITDRHRYRIEYSLATLTPGSEVDWDAVGFEWEVPIEHAEIHLLTPFELAGARCFVGEEGSREECALREVEPGHVTVDVDGVGDGRGVSIEATVGDLLESAPAGPSPPAPPRDEGVGLLLPAVLAGLVALVAAMPVSVAIRRRGRERVAVGGPADAAFAVTHGDASAGEAPYRLVDHTELTAMATTDVAPPEHLSPAMGGVVLAETVENEHKVAWLIDAAIAGHIELEGSGRDVTLHRLEGRVDGETATVLDLAVPRGASLELGKYDPAFASMWSEVGSRLFAWQAASGLWDPAGTTRRTIVRVIGIACTALGAVALFVGALFAARWGGAWLALLTLGAIAFGGGWAATWRAWELKVRTPAGVAAWLRVESFRRFLHESEAFHAEEAAKRGVLREYTAWAVAVGEVDRWSRAVQASSTIPQDAGLHYVAIAPSLGSATSSASTAPSSSGGGGGGGSAGGGGGGGGGGSW